MRKEGMIMNENHDNWDDHWEEYADAAKQNPAQYMRHMLVSSILQRLEESPTMRLLDVGSGQGDMLAILRPRFPRAEFVGAELSTSGVEISKRKVPDATFVVADLYNPGQSMLPFVNWATCATCSEVLEHLDDPAAFLKSAGNYLADNARIIITVPSGPMSRFDKHIGHRQHFSRESIKTLLGSAGFTVDYVWRAGFPFFNLYRLVVIARGSRLIEDVRSDKNTPPSKLARAAMRVFHGLFRFNLKNFPLGWQIVAVARKARK